MAVSAHDEYGRTALHYAALGSQPRVAQLLIDNGADVTARNKWGETPLHTAAYIGSEDIAEILLAAGADVEAKDAFGLTPLHQAARGCRLRMLSLLLGNGADAQAKTKTGDTALSLTRKTFQARIRDLHSSLDDCTASERLLQAAAGTQDGGGVTAAAAAPKAASAQAKNITSAEEFADRALAGSARFRLPIGQIPAAVAALTKKLQDGGVPARALHDLFNDSLLSVCPICSQYCAGKALLSMEWMGEGNVRFAGNSGGFERMLQGRCLNYSCGSTEHELFWCPDLNPKDLAELNSRGIRIDPDVQRRRDHVWKPQQ